MSRIKKTLAVLVVMVMVIAMVVPVAAYNAVEVPITGAGTGATFQTLHLIRPNVVTSTGWEFTNAEIATVFKSSFGIADDPSSDKDEQNAIWMLILNKDSTVSKAPSGISAANDEQFASALSGIATGTFTLTNSVKKVTVDQAGVYYIKGTETGYRYSPMAAFVSFGYSENGIPSSLVTEGVVAKKVKDDIEKSAVDKDKVTQIGQVEKFQITTDVPFLPLTDTNRCFKIIDKIDGAVYAVNSDEKVTVTVKIGTITTTANGEKTIDAPVYTGSFEGTVNETGDSFTVDLSTLLEDNTYANKGLLVEYQATVTKTKVGNHAYAGDGTNEGKDKYGSDSEDLFTGSLTLLKYGDNVEKKVLANAGFEVSINNGNALTFRQDTQKDKDDKEVPIPGQYTYDINGKITEVFTNADGTVTVKGLDIGTYHFTEKTAPEGYSINEAGKDITISLKEGVTEAASETDIVNGSDKLNDTKLNALPSTGGIGTTIFTVGGCLIMIAAAALFFINRRKASK